MKTENEKLIATLNNLIETCKDGQNGFRAAAQGAHDEHLKMLFSRYAGQRAAFAADLQQVVRRHGGDPRRAAASPDPCTAAGSTSSPPCWAGARPPSLPSVSAARTRP